MNFRPIILAAAGALVVLTAAAPAYADWDRGGRGDHRRYEERNWRGNERHERWERGYGRPVYAPPPVYYAPPAYYYRAPPPVYYGPRW
jgi:hypothetical protein